MFTFIRLLESQILSHSYSTFALVWKNHFLFIKKPLPLWRVFLVLYTGLVYKLYWRDEHSDKLGVTKIGIFIELSSLRLKIFFPLLFSSFFLQLLQFFSIFSSDFFFFILKPMNTIYQI